jgi:hypothetical protein
LITTSCHRQLYQFLSINTHKVSIWHLSSEAEAEEALVIVEVEVVAEEAVEALVIAAVEAVAVVASVLEAVVAEVLEEVVVLPEVAAVPLEVAAALVAREAVPRSLLSLIVTPVSSLSVAARKTVLRPATLPPASLSTARSVSLSTSPFRTTMALPLPPRSSTECGTLSEANFALPLLVALMRFTSSLGLESCTSVLPLVLPSLTSLTLLVPLVTSTPSSSLPDLAVI